MRVIIAGGRDFNDYEMLKEKCKGILRRGDTVVSGMARGADSLGLLLAERNGLHVAEYPAEWDKYGNSAGHKRNFRMSQNADALIAFWDGFSKGTKNMIEQAHAARLDIHVFYYRAGNE